MARVLPQVHNDLKTKNILLSNNYETAKIGAPVTLCASMRRGTRLLDAQWPQCEDCALSLLRLLCQ